MMAHRLYHVVDTSEGGAQHLVRAYNPAAAIRHVVGNRYSAKPAAPETCVELTLAGQLVMDATGPQQELPEPDAAAPVTASGKAIKPDSDYPDEG